MAKINVDGAWDASTFKAGIGVVIRNNHGSLLWGSSTFGSFNSSVETEAAALVKGLTEAANLRIRNIHVESDNLEVINALNMKIERGYATPQQEMAIQELEHSFRIHFVAIYLTYLGLSKVHKV